MIHSYEELDLLFRLIFIILIWPFPLHLQHRFFPSPFLCYIKGELPTDSTGEVNLALLNRLDWGRLPINTLWPHIRDQTSVQALLPGHCSSLKLEQILWVAENDSTRRAILLKNLDCMLKVKWNGLELDDFLNLLPELPVYSFSNFDVISEEIIVEGLIRHEFVFPDSTTLCSFLERLPRYILMNSKILSDPHAINLFCVDCFFRSNVLIRPLSTFLFAIQKTSQPDTWRQHLLELYDYLKTFPRDDTLDIFFKCDVTLQEMELEASSLPKSEMSLALHARDPSYFKSIDPLQGNFFFGPFDQYRLLLTLLSPASLDISENFDIFIKFYEEGVFEDWLLRLFFFTDHPEITTAIHSLPVSQITSTALLRFFTLKQDKPPAKRNRFITPPSDSQPVQVPLVKDLKCQDELLHCLFRLFSKHLQLFSQSTFRISYANDAVIDLGGPLLDWITGVLQVYVNLGLFAGSVEAEARTFIDPAFFKYLGLLHGKLLQIGTGPTWLPAISDAILENVASLASLHSNPAEAARLFNDFEFPLLNQQNRGGAFRVCSHVEITYYLRKLERMHAAWKSLAWQEYQNGLDYFLLPNVPQGFVKCLLQPLPAPTANHIAKVSTVKSHPSIPSVVWHRVLETFSFADLVSFLIFTTGQCRPVPITVIISHVAQGRLPHAQTCSRELFLYLPPSIPADDENSIIEHLSESLKIAIHNYEGFGNS